MRDKFEQWVRDNYSCTEHSFVTGPDGRYLYTVGHKVDQGMYASLEMLWSAFISGWGLGEVSMFEVWEKSIPKNIKNLTNDLRYTDDEEIVTLVGSMVDDDGISIGRYGYPITVGELKNISP